MIIPILIFIASLLGMMIAFSLLNNKEQAGLKRLWMVYYAMLMSLIFLLQKIGPLISIILMISLSLLSLFYSIFRLIKRRNLGEVAIASTNVTIAIIILLGILS